MSESRGLGVRGSAKAVRGREKRAKKAKRNARKAFFRAFFRENLGFNTLIIYRQGLSCPLYHT